MSNKNTRSDLRISMREEEARPQTHWSPPALLDAPKARPGYVQRWVATTIQGKATPDNVYKRMREGWEPRKSETVKEQHFPTINHGEWVGCIGIEGMLLCEMPKERHKAQKDYYKNKSSEANESIAGDLDALGRNNGQRIYQDRVSNSSRGRDLSVMDD